MDCEAKKESGVSVQMTRLDKGMEDLGTVVDSIESRLQSILRSEPVCDKADVAAKGWSCIHVEMLAIYANKAESLSSRLRSVLDRLEL